MHSISIPSIVSCHICPIRFMLEQERKPKEEPENYTIAKQISYHLGEEMDPGEIWDEIKTVNPELSKDSFELYTSWIEKCKNSPWPRSSQQDVRVSSDKFGIHGNIDRLFDSPPYIALLRLTPAPDIGIYSADRVRAACYSLCAKEALGKDANEIILEYIPSGTSKTCKISPRDRREALYAIKTAKKILSGYVPVKNKTMPCGHCYLKDKCVPEPKKLSDLL
ncbi:CRISPR-associated exonuclease Cas4 [Methanomicrobium sp. W14]|uniref:CRISPR-associated protein Cas4 n=1 Tax=Methanomicrobium sp. W14 TaxID=2817839 RepID=UPI001AE3AD07|nr:Dna2/Cas4 domain-containing protein [Methanomicrobium sp. W14]MBP2132958.1 CRISPR-associated exonuclease Cas4 [Methanomicrobium sp. W14]